MFSLNILYAFNMIDSIDFLPVGDFTRTHGIGGELILRLQVRETEGFHEMEWVFVEIDGLPVPFFVSQIRDLQEDKMILQLETVTTEAQARELTGCKLFIPAKRRAGKKPGDTGIANIKGYTVWDETHGELGIADQIVAIAGNPLLKIISGKKEILIPAHPDIILEINDTKKRIRIHAPEGLTEL
jgi:16S rRNA processing protein RimM